MKRLALLLMIALMLVSSVSAQSDTLSADDVVMLTNALALKSFAFDYQFQLAEDLDTFTVAADLSGSGAVDREAPALSASLAGSLTLGTAQHGLDSEVRWVGDTLYLNGDGWQALDDAPSALADLIGDVAGLSADTGALSTWNLLGIDGFNQLWQTATKDPGLFVKAERRDDEGASAHFQMTADLHALFDSDNFVDGIVALGNEQGSDMIARTRDTIAQMMRTNNQAINPAALTLDMYIGLDDNLLQRMTINLDMRITPADGGFVGEPFTVSLNLDMMLSDQNQTQAIDAPDGAQTVAQIAFPALPQAAASASGTTQRIEYVTLGEEVSQAYPFEAQAGDVVTITARRWALDSDAYLDLFSPGGELLITNDDHDAPGYALTDYDAQIADFAIEETGTYSVEVSDSTGDPGGSYLLTITIQR